MSARLTGLADSGFTRPRMKSPIITGTSVIDSSEAAAIASILPRTNNGKNGNAAINANRTAPDTANAAAAFGSQSADRSIRVRPSRARSVRLARTPTKGSQT